MSPLTLWLTDRTRYTTGTSHCQTERYFKNHFGPTGYGIVRKAESLPLMTGSYTHAAFETLWKYLQQHDSFPTVAVIRQAIADALGQYEKRIASRGYRGLLQSERGDEILREQQYLITGLIWAVCRTVLPWIHTNYRILQAEQETIYVLDCTCGLGSGELDPARHDALGCLGIGQMLKQDAVAQHRTRGTLAYFEVKTTGSYLDNWAPQWETKPQLAIGNFGIKERYGQDVEENYIIGLFKGQRKKVKSDDPFKDGQQVQDSAFCYGYFKAGNPPLATDDWKPAYEWVDDNGETKFARKPYAKAGVWEMIEGDWPTWVASHAADPSLTPAEVWVYSLPKSVLDKQVFLVGPLNRQAVQIESLKHQIVGEERRWQERLWKLYDAQEHGQSWADPAFQALLQSLVSASWECRRFGVRHSCEFTGICFRQDGWEDPLGTGLFTARRPHHQPELDQAISRGLLPEQSEEDEGGDD